MKILWLLFLGQRHHQAELKNPKGNQASNGQTMTPWPPDARPVCWARNSIGNRTRSNLENVEKARENHSCQLQKFLLCCFLGSSWLFPINSWIQIYIFCSVGRSLSLQKKERRDELVGGPNLQVTLGPIFWGVLRIRFTTICFSMLFARQLIPLQALSVKNRGIDGCQGQVTSSEHSASEDGSAVMTAGGDNRSIRTV